MPLVPVVMPQMGESVAEGTVVRWLKAAGDPVERDEPLVEISTDKVDTEVPSPVAGVLREIVAREGATVAVNEPVARIEVAGADRQAPAPSAEPEAGGHFQSPHAPQTVSFRTEAAAPPQGAGPATAQPVPPAGPRSYSPAVLAAAQRHAVPLGVLTTMAGSGRGGRLTKRDVDRFAATTGPGSPIADSRPPAPDHRPPPEFLYHPRPGDRVVPMTPARRQIAHHMTWSARISPQATAFAECDMSRAAAVVERTRDARRLTYTAIVAHAAVAALRDFPVLNASVVGDAIVLKDRVHLGVAVALPDAGDLVVPVVRDAQELSLDGLAHAIEDLAIRARAGRLRLEDVQGGTFTLTNPGVFGGLGGTPILHQPQVAILGLGAVTPRAVVVGEAIAVRPIMMMSLTFDHRATDGMAAFGYLEAVRRRLEQDEPRAGGPQAT